MNKHEGQALLAEQLRPYRERTFAELSSLVGHDERLDLTGPSGQGYQVEISIFWDHTVGGNVRVMGSIDDGGLRAFVPLSDSFIMAPDGKFVGES
jgi:hypothetical protein